MINTDMLQGYSFRGVGAPHLWAARREAVVTWQEEERSGAVQVDPLQSRAGMMLKR